MIRTIRITENLVLLLNDNVVKLFFSMKTSVDIFWKTTPLNLVNRTHSLFMYFWGERGLEIGEKI